MNSVAQIAFLAMPLLMLSCSPKQPNAANLVGQYTATEQTLRRLKSEGYPPRDISIDLEQDGTLSFHNIPDCWLTDFGQPHGKFDSGAGRWELQNRDGVWQTVFDVESFTPDSASSGRFGIGFNVTRNKPPHGLAVPIAAGDAGYLEFQRK